MSARYTHEWALGQAGSAIHKVDSRGRIGLSMVTYDEIMGLIIVVLDLAGDAVKQSRDDTSKLMEQSDEG